MRIPTITSSRQASVLLLLAAFASAGCPRDEGERPVPYRVRVLSFTEAGPVTAVHAAGSAIFVATSAGVDRWMTEAGSQREIATSNNLAGEPRTLEYDDKRGLLWVGTTAGLYRWSDRGGLELSAPPTELSPEPLRVTALARSSGGGLWVGTEGGLLWRSGDGTWQATGVGDPVTALVEEAPGRLLVGTGAGLFATVRGGSTLSLGAEQGCEVASVRLLSRGPDGVAAVGETAGGEQRVLFRSADGCRSYRVSPAEKWLSISPYRGGMLVMTEQRLYSLSHFDSSPAQLRRRGARLIPTARARGEGLNGRYSLSILQNRLPRGASAAVAVGSDIVVGTRTVGAVRLRLPWKRGARDWNRKPKITWLRRSDLVVGAEALSVACTDANNCYVANGTERAWRFDGSQFSSFGADSHAVLAVTRAPDGSIYAIRQAPDAPSLAIHRIVNGEWVEPAAYSIDTPGRATRLTFARFSPSGVLWLGLRYLDDEGEYRPYGVALVNVNLGIVAYHHASHDEGAIEKGVLPIPVNVVDAAFCGETVWLASTQGAARLIGEKVKVFYEADGLASELLRGIACDRNGRVYVASGPGVGVYDSKTWTYPRGLQWSVNGIAVGKDNRLWLATTRGLVSFDGSRSRRLDARRGLLENHLHNIAIDHLDRVWVLGAQGLSVVSH